MHPPTFNVYPEPASGSLTTKLKNMSTVSSQITDAVTQANVKVVAEAPAMAMGSLYQTMSHSVSQAAQSAVSAQHIWETMQKVATEHGITTVYNGKVPAKGLTDQHVMDHLQGIMDEHTGKQLKWRS